MRFIKSSLHKRKHSRSEQLTDNPYLGKQLNNCYSSLKVNTVATWLV